MWFPPPLSSFVPTEPKEIIVFYKSEAEKYNNYIF